MDYSQFLYMKEELSLVAVILIIFLADLFMNPDKRNNMNNARFATILPIVLMVIHTIINLVPAAVAPKLLAECISTPRCRPSSKPCSISVQSSYFSWLPNG